MDLIGMGKSDKPGIPHRLHDRVPIADGFVEAMGLNDAILVIHDWDSGLEFHYAHRRSDNVRGRAFMDAI